MKSVRFALPEPEMNSDELCASKRCEVIEEEEEPEWKFTRNPEYEKFILEFSNWSGEHSTKIRADLRPGGFVDADEVLVNVGKHHPLLPEVIELMENFTSNETWQLVEAKNGWVSIFLPAMWTLWTGSSIGWRRSRRPPLMETMTKQEFWNYAVMEFAGGVVKRTMFDWRHF